MACRMRIRSGAYPPGMTSASKSPLRPARGDVRGDACAALARVLRAGQRSDERDDDAGVLEPLQWSSELGVLVALFDEHRHALAGELMTDWLAIAGATVRPSVSSRSATRTV